MSAEFAIKKRLALCMPVIHDLADGRSELEMPDGAINRTQIRLKGEKIVKRGSMSRVEKKRKAEHGRTAIISCMPFAEAVPLGAAYEAFSYAKWRHSGKSGAHGGQASRQFESCLHDQRPKRSKKAANAAPVVSITCILWDQAGLWRFCNEPKVTLYPKCWLSWICIRT